MDKVGSNLNLDVSITQKNIDDYLQSMKNKDFYSLELLRAKLNNYCTGVKEELKYKVYELLNENGFSVDEIEENQNIIAEELKSLKLEFMEEGSDHNQLKLDVLIEDFNKKLDNYVEQRIALEKSPMSSYSNEYNFKRKKLNDLFIGICIKFINDLSKLKKSKNLLISTDEISKLIDKLINSDLEYIKMFRKNLKRKLREINIRTEKSSNNKSKALIIENAKDYLADVFNVYEKRIQILSAKECNSLEDKSVEEVKSDYEAIDNAKIECFDKSEDYYKDLNNTNNEGSKEKIDKNNNHLNINEEIAIRNVNNLFKNTENIENENSISIENITIKTSNNKTFDLKELLDEDDKEIYEEIEQKILFLIEKKNKSIF